MSSKGKKLTQQKRRRSEEESEEEVEEIIEDPEILEEEEEEEDSDVEIDTKISKTKRVEVPKKAKPNPLEHDVLRGKDEISILLNDRKRVSIRKFQGKVLIDFREFYEKDGLWLPGKKGITFAPDLWQKIKNHAETIDEAIKTIK